MPTNITRELRQIARFAALSRYIDAHLDDDLDLTQLADVAGISRHRLDGDFHAYALETPMSRVWRLRLLRARQRIIERPELPLLDVALDAAYGSAQAFSRAFRRLHGQAPSAFRNHVVASRPPLRIEYLPRMAVQYVPYAGPRGELRIAANELRARAMHAGIARHKRFGWSTNVKHNLCAGSDSQSPEVRATLLHAPLEQHIQGLDKGSLGGDAYAVFHFDGSTKQPVASVLTERIARETGWQAADGEWLRRCRNAQYLPSFLESRFEVYIPVRPLDRDARIAPVQFVLEK